MTGDPRCAVGVPNVGPFGVPRLLVELAVAAEEHGWDGFFVWDHLLYHDQRWDVADPLAVIAAVAARTARIRIGVLVNVLARRRIGEVARESVTVDLLSGGRLVVGAGVEYTLRHRTGDGPFDVILEGRTDGAAPDRGAGQVAPYLEAVLTWWIEALGWWRGSPQDTMNRVRQGPPELARHQP